MKTRFSIWIYLFIFFQAAFVEKMTGQFTISDTTLANRLLPDALDFYEVNQYDTAWTMMAQILDIYGSTVGLEFSQPCEALRIQGIIKFETGYFAEAIPLLHTCLQHATKVFGETGRWVANPNAYLGVCYPQLGEFDKGLFYLHRALDIRLNHLGKYHYRVSENYNNIGTTLWFRGNFREAQEYFLHAIEVDEGREEPQQQDSVAWSLHCLNAGIAYKTLGEIKKGIQFFQKSFGLLPDEDWPELYYQKASTLAEIANSYYTLGDYPNAISLYEQTLDLLQKSGNAEHPDVGLYFNNLSAAWSALGVETKEQYYIQAALAHWEKIRHKETLGKASNIVFIVDTWLSLGGAAQQKGDLNTAIAHSLKALQLAEELKNTNKQRVVSLTLGSLYQQAGQADSAEVYFARSLPGPDAQENDLTELVSAPGKYVLFRLMRARQSGNPQQIKAAWSDWTAFDRKVSDQRLSLSEGVSRSSFSKILRPVYESAIEEVLPMKRPDAEMDWAATAFALSEKMRALNLFEAIKEADARTFSGLPDSLLARERDLRLDLNWTENQLYQKDITPGTPPDTEAQRLMARIDILNETIAKLQKTFETDYPDYYRLKYDLRVEDVAAVQRDLLYPDMALVEYFVGNSAVYIFTIRKQDYSVLEVKKDFPLEQWVSQLREGMTAFQTGQGMEAKYDSLSALYTDAASNIYKKLVAPIAAKLPAKVIFIPDGVLGYVPFEALLVEKPDNPTRWPQHHYLLNDHSVSYCYSATMLREMLYRKHQQQPALGFLGFAPAYDGDTTLLDSLFRYDDGMRKDLKALPYSGEEVYRVAKMLKGQAVVGAAASRAAFTEQAGQARILHLATHGQANDRAGDYCFLVFAGETDSAENELLYARDIYNLQLNADLVTLSACETGIGELQGGEGIISLARAFAYAGAKSIVTSLWSVSDAKTKDLMIDFYKNLRKGMLKDDALRQAKLDFLKRNRGQAAHPFYWAGFVGIGNMGKIR